MSLRSPTENENAWERFLASARNDNACHLERSERSFSNPIFEGGHEGHEGSDLFLPPRRKGAKFGVLLLLLCAFATLREIFRSPVLRFLRLITRFRATCVSPAVDTR